MRVLSPQAYKHKRRVLSQHVFVTTNICRDKSFVATKIFCRDKHNFFATKLVRTSILLSRQKTKQKTTTTKTCFVTRKHFSRQKSYLWQLPPMIICLCYQIFVQSTSNIHSVSIKYSFSQLFKQDDRVGLYLDAVKHFTFRSSECSVFAALLACSCYG